jgi:glutathione S-transferase
MKLYIGNKKYSSWSLRPWLVLKHIGVSFQEVLIPLDLPSTHRQILEISPSGRVPALEHNGNHLWESLAICEYINEVYPDKKLWPSSVADRALARSIANEMHGGFQALREACPMKVGESFPEFTPSEAVTKDVKRIDELWRHALERGAGPFLFGQFTIADAMFAPVAFRVQSYNLKLSSRSRDYTYAMLNYPAMQEWAKAAKNEDLVMKRYATK